MGTTRKNRSVKNTKITVDPLSRLGVPPFVHWISNKLRVKCVLPVEIFPGYDLRPAAADERKRIRIILRDLGAGDRYLTPYEKGKGIKLSSSPQTFAFSENERFRYFVLQPRHPKNDIDSQIEFEQFRKIAAVCDSELTFPVSLFPSGVYMGSTRIGASPLGRSEIELLFHGPYEFDDEDVSQINSTVNAWKQLPQDFPAINRAIDMYYGLNNVIALSNSLFTLGLFGIIESLLTHQTKGGFDQSLRHQISRKMLLLNHQMAWSIDYKMFGNQDEKKIWERLYDCRSAIAHGGNLDFSKSDLKRLKDLTHVNEFLSRITKLLIRTALQHPRLIADLQAC